MEELTQSADSLALAVDLANKSDSMVRLFGIKMVNVEDFANLILRFGMNMAVLLVLIGFLYFRRGGRKDFFFTHMVLSTVVFLLCFLLESVKIQLGFALGLFAVFGILRYRTDAIPIKEMSYLFAAIGVSIINALANKKVSYAELLFANFAMLGTVAALEYWFLGRGEQSMKVIYEKIELIQPARKQELYKDLRDRLGVEIVRVEKGLVSFLRDTVELTVFYHQNQKMK